MSVYVDALVEHPLGTVRGAERVKYWCHMWADTEPELHDMAVAIGMRRSWFQDGHRYHYDLSQARRAHAVRLGAIEISYLKFLRQQRRAT